MTETRGNDDNLVEVWEFPQHTYDDDGYQAKCFGEGETTLVPICGDTQECPECHQQIKPTYMGCFPA